MTRSRTTADQFAAELTARGCVTRVEDYTGTEKILYAKRAGSSIKAVFDKDGGFSYALRNDVQLDLALKLRSMAATRRALGL